MDAAPAAIDAHLRRLAPSDVAALVADLWAARGYETRRADRLVVAERGDETVRVGVAGVAADAPPDVLVTTAVDGREGDAVSGETLDTADLRDLLLFAVDDATGRRLCEQHLGAPPAALQPPGWWQRHVEPRSRRLRGVASPRRLVGLVAVTLLVLGAVVLGGAIGLDGGDGPTPGASSAPGSTPAATAAPIPTVTDTDTLGLESVPGVTTAGITDPAALVARHDRALGDRYTLWADVYWRSAAAPLAGWHQRDVDVAVDGDRYLLAAALDPANDSVRRPVLSVYADGTARYVASYGADGSASYRTLDDGEPSPARVPSPAALRNHVLAGLLTTPSTAFGGLVEEEGESYYRATVTGPPGTAVPRPDGGLVPPQHVRDYTAVVLIDGAGRIVSFEAQYTLTDRTEPLVVRFELTHDRLGETTVTRPTWVERAVTDETAS